MTMGLWGRQPNLDVALFSTSTDFMHLLVEDEGVTKQK